MATYAATCLWNFKPLFIDEHVDNLDNLSTLITFTGSIDESWFYLTSVAIEARGAPIIPLMLTAIAAARMNDAATVTLCLKSFAERLDDLGGLLQRMHENCDPHVFYHHIRPFLAGSKNMSEAGLPNGVIYMDGISPEKYRQYSGGSNAQSTLIQFFDVILGVSHLPTGDKRDLSSESELEGTAPPSKHNFIHDMRSYMPGPHRRFLEDVGRCANIRDFVEAHHDNRDLALAYDFCLVMLRSFRDKHINIVSRYIILKSREARSLPVHGVPLNEKINLAVSSQKADRKKNLKGTGGTALLPFLKQARDETGLPAVDAWTRRVLNRDQTQLGNGDFFLGKVDEMVDGSLEVNGLAGSWTMDGGEGGGLCHY